MKKIYICPEIEETSGVPVQFICASTRIIDGGGGPQGPVKDDEDEPTEEDSFGKGNSVWEEWGNNPTGNE